LEPASGRSSGSRIVISLIYGMKKRKNKYGLASLCAAGGMGTAVIVEVL
jgi:acetyl-CoA C-acetyltransferase